MIRTWRHKGLKALYETGSKKGVQADQVKRLRLILGLLDAAKVASDMGFPGSGLHPLKGDRDGHWAVIVSGNWRLVFKIKEGAVLDVDLVDYHKK